MQWQPPQQPSSSNERRSPATSKRWLPAAIIGSAVVIAAGLVVGAVILKGKDGGAADGGMTTCQAWAETRQTVRAVPALPQGWNGKTPNIDTYIQIQNAPVGNALDLFEPKIVAEPTDVAQAAQEYVAVRRKQMQSLADRTYVPADGASVDNALAQLDQVCGIDGNG